MLSLSSHLLNTQRTGNIKICHKAGNVSTGDLAVVDIIEDHNWIPPGHALGLLRHLGLLVLPVDVGDGQTVQLPHSGQHRHRELITLVSKEVWEVGTQQDDAIGQIPVILAGR